MNTTELIKAQIFFLHENCSLLLSKLSSTLFRPLKFVYKCSESEKDIVILI